MAVQWWRRTESAGANVRLSGMETVTAPREQLSPNQSPPQISVSFICHLILLALEYPEMYSL